MPYARKGDWRERKNEVNRASRHRKMIAENPLFVLKENREKHLVLPDINAAIDEALRRKLGKEST